MENTGHFWKSKEDSFQILQPFRKSGNWWSDYVVQRKGDCQTICSQKAQAFWHQNLQTLQLNWLHREVHLGKDRQCTAQHLTTTHATVTKLTKKIKRPRPQIVHGQFLDCNELDGQERCQHANIHDPPQVGNFRNEEGNVIKPKIVVDYNYHLGYVNKGNRMANSYSAVRHGSGQKKLFFHLLKLAILNSYLLLSSCGGKKISQRFLTCPFS